MKKINPLVYIYIHTHFLTQFSFAFWFSLPLRRFLFIYLTVGFHIVSSSNLLSLWLKKLCYVLKEMPFSILVFQIMSPCFQLMFLLFHFTLKLLVHWNILFSLFESYCMFYFYMWYFWLWSGRPLYSFFSSSHSFTHSYIWAGVL